MMDAPTNIQRTPLSRRSASSLLVTFVAALFAAIGLLLVAVERTDAQAQGEVWAWGDNAFGQLGDRTNTNRNTPVRVTGLSGVQAVAAGEKHSLALKNDGTVWAWGSNEYSQLGDGTNTNRNTPVQVLSGVQAIAAGQLYSLALKNDGTVWAWGRNNWGQLGDGTTTQRNTPVQVRGLTGVEAFDGGGNHSLAVASSDAAVDTAPGPPKVTSTVPTANATGVAPTTNVTATFSEDMDARTIDDRTFKLFRKGTTTKLAATVEYDAAATDTATLDPTDPLQRGVTYKAVVTTGAKDLAGNSLDQNSSKTGSQPHKWFFTVSQ
jgi:hypothetical protein